LAATRACGAARQDHLTPARASLDRTCTAARSKSPWVLTPISERVGFTGDPLAMPEYDQENHLVRLMDDRDWYCYETNALSTLCTPRPALNNVSAGGAPVAVFLNTLMTESGFVALATEGKGP
jgi:hypothetical protein